MKLNRRVPRRQLPRRRREASNNLLTGAIVSPRPGERGENGRNVEVGPHEQPCDGGVAGGANETLRGRFPGRIEHPGKAERPHRRKLDIDN